MLDDRSALGELFEKLPDGKVRCLACAHRCVIAPGKRGICQVRFNRGGELRGPRGYVAAFEAEPVEKKPFFHVLPGSLAGSFGMLGCDYHCDYCQNWITSQALRDPASEAAGARPMDLAAGEIVRSALDRGCRSVVSTYNEPLITAEWAAEVFRQARAGGLLTGFVSNGNATREALEFLRPHLDLYKVDLKGFDDAKYRRVLGGPLKPVLETIERAKAMGFWVEVVTLVVPGFNDEERQLVGIADFIASVSRDIPWHVTAFHPDYRMGETPFTGPEGLKKAWKIGKAAGLHYVYSGNLPGEVGPTENTYCPHCDELLVQRFGHQVLEDRLGAAGKCPGCGAAIPGVWVTPEREANPVTAVEGTPLTERTLGCPVK
jgi:pyruvate formate lyase activating enzyme